MKMLRTIIFLSMAIAVLSHDLKIHEHMTHDEVKSIFGTKREDVPDYEVVPVAHGISMSLKNNRIIHFISFKQNITLYLKPTDGYLAGVKTPVFKARSNSKEESGIEYQQIYDVIKPEHTLYHDPANLAAVLIDDTNESNNVSIHGVIDDLAIRPLPQRLRRHYNVNRRKRSAENESSSSNNTTHDSNLEDTHHHILFKLNTPTQQNKQNDSKPIESIEDAAQVGNKVPQIIHPQILVIVETTLFEIFKKNVEDTVNYIVSFWNGVDLRYRTFTEPNVRINIAGIILAEDPNATAYIQSNMIQIPGQQEPRLSVITALRKKTQLLFPDTVYNETENILKMRKINLEFDSAITMTTKDLCSFNSACITSGKYTCSPYTVRSACVTLGYAYYTGACAYNSTTSEMEAVGIVEDKGAFNGILPAAHEVGHLLGASHSITNEHRCPIDDGLMMSFGLVVTRKSFTWSNCSVSSIYKFLQREPRAQCLFNEPDTGNQTERVLPGKLLTRDEMCNRLMGTKSCMTQRCNKLFCLENNSTDSACIHAQYVPVPEGTACGEGRYCINSRCVEESKQSVSLKIALSPAVARRYGFH